MNIAICDNDSTCRRQVCLLVQAYAATHSAADIFISEFERGDDLLDSARKLGGYDIYILDILMPGLNGIELGMLLREADFNGKILYLTSSKEYAIDAFRVKAFQYILKPIDKTVFTSALHEAVSVIAAKPSKSLLVKTKDATIRLPISNILYAELTRRCIVYHLAGGKTVESNTIRTAFSEMVQPLLRDPGFVLCGASTVVNLRYITLVDHESVEFQNKTRLYLSKKTCRELRSVWYDYWFDKEEML